MKKKSWILGILFIALLGLMNVKVCLAHTIYRELPIGRTESGTVSIDNCVDGERNNDYKEACYDFTYDTNEKKKLKFTVTISNLRKASVSWNYSPVSIWLSDDTSDSNDSEPILFEYIECENGVGTISKVVTTTGDIYFSIGDAKEYGIESFDYVLTVEDLTVYSEELSMPTTLNLKTNEVQKISYRNVYPSNILSYGITWTSSNSRVAEVDESGEVTAVKPGSSFITAQLKNGKTYKCLVTVKNPNPYINTKNYKMCIGETYKLKINYNSKKVKWSSSNKKIATVSSKGKIKAKGIGTCKITGKVGKKKYTCKVKVVRQWPNYAAVLEEYNTRDNYFVVAFYNKSNKNLIIQPGGAKVEHVAYKSYDRYLSLEGENDIVIKPKTSARIKFYVNGSTTWYQVGRYTLLYRMKFDGVSYEAHTWNNDSVFKMKSKWYHTYTADDWYHGWQWLKK